MSQEGVYRRDALFSSFVLDGFKQPLVVLDQRGTVIDANRAAAGGAGIDLISILAKAQDDHRLRGFLCELRARNEHALELELPLENGIGRFVLEGTVIDDKTVIVARD